MRWCRLTAQALITAKDLVESGNEARVGATDYTILAAVQGSELELMRFLSIRSSISTCRRSLATT